MNSLFSIFKPFEKTFEKTIKMKTKWRGKFWTSGDPAKMITLSYKEAQILAEKNHERRIMEISQEIFNDEKKK